MAAPDLTGRSIADTYKDLLQVSNSNAGVDTGLKPVQDGEGTVSALKLSTAGIQSTGTLDVTGNTALTGTLTLGGVEITSTAAELNILDGVTSTAAELNILDGRAIGGSLGGLVSLGTGVVSPLAEIHVQGAGVQEVRIESDDQNAILALDAHTNNDGLIIFKEAGTEKGRITLAGDGERMAFTTAAVERLTILATGNVGVGVIDPDEQLELAGRVHLGQTTAPSTTTDKLYNVSGSLYWNGADISTAGDITGVTAGTNLSGGGTSGTVTLNVDNPVVANLTGTASLVTVTDSTAATAFPVVFNDESDALLDDTGTFTYKPSTGTVAATAFTGALTGNADTVTTNANLTGDVTSSGNATSIAAGVIVNADVKSDAAIAYSKLGTIPTWNQDTTGTAATVTGATQASITTCANLVTVGTIGTGVWQGTAVDGTYIDLEGTELKSTGETGATKFLREDGDGTSSWQAVTASVSIGTSIGSGTSGSVLFVDSSTQLAQDNSNFFWDDSNNRLGIGTAAPDSKLHISAAALDVGIKITSTGTDSYPNLSLENDNQRYSIYCDGTISDSLGIYDNTNSAYRMVIDTSGNVGIGTTAPTEMLHVYAGSNPTVLVEDSTNNCKGYLHVRDDNVIIGSKSDHVLHLATNNTNQVTVTTAGLVGVGGTPSELLHVIGGGDPTILVEDTTNNCKGMLKVKDDNVVIGAQSNHVLHLATNNTNQVTVDAAGLVGIGRTPTYALDVEGASRIIDTGGSAAILTIKNDEGSWSGGVDGTGGYIVTSAGVPFRIVADATTCLHATTAGNVGIGTAAPAARLSIEDSGADTNSLNIAQSIFYKSSGTPAIGLGSSIAFYSAQASDASQQTRVEIGGVAEAVTGSEKTAMVFTTPSAAGSGTQAERMRITQAGLVGIGTAAPENRCHIATGDSTTTGLYRGTDTPLCIETVGQAAYIQFVADADQTMGLLFADPGASQSARGGYLYDENEGLILRSGNVSRVFVTPAGLVGIGTAAPSTELHIKGAGAQELTIESDDHNAVLTLDADGNDDRLILFKNSGTEKGRITLAGADDRMGFTTAGTERLTISTAGLVGIGRTPTQQLDVEGAVQAGTSTIRSYLGGSSGESAATVGSFSDHPLHIRANQVTKLKLDTDGTLDLVDSKLTLGGGSGTDGYVLTTDGVGGVAWETASGGSGKILQVLNNTAVPGDVTDTSYTAAVAQAITPADTGNKVLLTAAANFKISYDDSNSEDGYLLWTLYRDSTRIGTEQHYINNDDMSYYDKWYSCSFTFLDSPSSTSAVTYSLKYQSYYSSGPSAHIYDAQITVQEVD